MNRKQAHATDELRAIVATLSPRHQQILRSLAERGPGLMLEIAVRLLLFPEDIRQPVSELRELGLIEAEAFSGGPLGSELLSLSGQGRRAVALLQDESTAQMVRTREEPPPTKSAAPDPRQQQVELLRRLGDLEAEAGDMDRAREYYQQALSVTRSLTPDGDPDAPADR